MAGKSIDDAFAAIMKDCREIAVKAVKDAAKETQKDIIKEANRSLIHYYESYRPKKYKRTYNLHKAIQPIFEDRSTNDNISITIGVAYDAKPLIGLYSSNSWYHQSGDAWTPVWERKRNQDNGIPEPEWILGNFLEGIHPWAQTDTESADSMMEDFFKTQVDNRAWQHIQDLFFNAIDSRL